MAGSSAPISVLSDDKIKKEPAELEEACVAPMDNIVIKHEPKYAEAIKESLFEGNDISSNSSQNKSPIMPNSNGNNMSRDGFNTNMPLIVKAEVNNVMPPLIYFNVNNTVRLQENIIQPIITSTSLKKESTSCFLKPEINIIYESDSRILPHIVKDGGEPENTASSIKLEPKDETLETLKEEELELIKEEEVIIPMETREWDTPLSAATWEDGGDSEDLPTEARYNANKSFDLTPESSIETQKHKCSECKFSSNKISLLKRHLRIHSSRHKLRCPECSYATDNRSVFKRHQRSHNKRSATTTTLRQYRRKADGLLKLSERFTENLSENISNESILLRQNPNQPEERSSNIAKENEGAKVILREQIDKQLAQMREYNKLNFYRKCRLISCDACEFRSTPDATMLHQFECRAYLLKQIKYLKQIKSTAKSSPVIDNDVQCNLTATDRNFMPKKPEESSVQPKAISDQVAVNSVESFNSSFCLFLKKTSEKLQEERTNYQTNFRCPECSYVATGPETLHRHRKTHKIFSNVSCAGCGFSSTPKPVILHQYKCEPYLLKQLEDLPEPPSEDATETPPPIHCENLPGIGQNEDLFIICLSNLPRGKLPKQRPLLPKPQT